MELIKVNLLHKIRFRLLFVQYKKVSRTLGSTYVFLGAPTEKTIMLSSFFHFMLLFS